MSDFDFKGFFPYPSVRDEQERAINFALDAFYRQGKRFVIIEAGTGTGKSGIGLAISRYMKAHPLPAHPTTLSLSRDPDDPNSGVKKGTWFLTTQKILQDQYVKDFGPPTGWMRSVKSAGNYQCSFKSSNSCAESRQLLKGEPDGSPFKRACGQGGCVYVAARTEWQESYESVTNFPYFMTFGNFTNAVPTRSLLVVDEAHNIEGELSKFIDVTVSEYFATRVLKLEVPNLRTQHQVVKWIGEVYFPKVDSHVKHIKEIMGKFKGLQDKLKKIASLARQLDMLTSHHSKVEKFLRVYDKENWVMNIVNGEGRSQRKFEFKVIDVSPFSEGNLFKFGDRVLLMSATILNEKAFCESLGIPEDQCAFLEIPTPFPVENRPIIVSPVGKMSRAHIDVTLPKMADTIKMILDHHKGEKGIIHTHTFRNANFFKRQIRNSRLLVHDSANREDILQKHLDSKKPTVLLSPSMTEGVDLKGDASRFQIICKVPYPYLGDPLTKKRMNRWPWWYGLQTSKCIVQSVGRSIRSSEDHAVTYILDADWGYFFSRNRDMFPTSFKDALS